MSSLMTNASAMTALKTLQMTNKNLDQTENRISTGYKVATASDNAAYWSIATTMRSDNKALSTVQDALGLGAATVDVAYTAMDSVKDVLDQIKTKLVSATQPGVDKSKIQSDITELQKQLQTYASSASFSGNNWLSVDSSSSSYKATQSVVSSFTRSPDNQVSIGTIDIDITGISLFDSSTAQSGILQGGTAASATTTSTFDSNFSSGLDLNGASSEITFKIALDDGSATTVTLDKSEVDAALGTTDGKVTNAADLAKVVNHAMGTAGVTGVTASEGTGTDAGKLVFTGTSTGSSASVAISAVSSTDGTDPISGAAGMFADLSANGANTGGGIMDIDITNASDAQLKNYTDMVESMSAKVTTGAANLGSVKDRIDMQQDFVKNLMDAVDRGVGALVDADMSEESTKLQALQTQQQLGIQALSIANSNSQSILSLFR
ncbi:MAG: flagellin C [Rhizobiales bacterium]|nr:flagellin C [Hyphomicrobiales bacterium]